MNASATLSPWEIDEQIRAMPSGMPHNERHNIAIAGLLVGKGIRIERNGLFGLRGPSILPPFEVVWDSCTCCWFVRQGAPLEGANK